MRLYQETPVTQDVLIQVTCDRCKATVDPDDTLHFQEWIAVCGAGGPESDFWGDQLSWQIDLCEKCQHELFSPFARCALHS